VSKALSQTIFAVSVFSLLDHNHNFVLRDLLEETKHWNIQATVNDWGRDWGRLGEFNSSLFFSGIIAIELGSVYNCLITLHGKTRTC